MTISPKLLSPGKTYNRHISFCVSNWDKPFSLRFIGDFGSSDNTFASPPSGKINRSHKWVSRPKVYFPSLVTSVRGEGQSQVQFCLFSFYRSYNNEKEGPEHRHTRHVPYKYLADRRFFETRLLLTQTFLKKYEK